MVLTRGGTAARRLLFGHLCFVAMPTLTSASPTSSLVATVASPRPASSGAITLLRAFRFTCRRLTRLPRNNLSLGTCIQPTTWSANTLEKSIFGSATLTSSPTLRATAFQHRIRRVPALPTPGFRGTGTPPRANICLMPSAPAIRGTSASRSSLITGALGWIGSMHLQRLFMVMVDTYLT